MISLPQNFWIKLILFSLVFLIVSFVFYALNILIIPITLGFLMAFLIEPVIGKLEGRNISRMKGIAGVFAIIMLLILGFLFSVTPILKSEIKSFKANQERYKDMALIKYQDIKTKLEGYFPDSIPWDDFEKNAAHFFASASTKWLTKIPKLLAGSAETIMSFIIIIPLMAFFILKDGLTFKRWIIHFVPNRYFELTMEILHNINQQTGAFIRGQILDSSLNAILVSMILFAIGLPYFLIVGVFAGIANAIPFVGPVAAGSVGVLIAVLTGGPAPWIVIAAFLVAHLIDVMLIYPKTVGHSLNLHELVVILGIILGGHLGGIIGMLVIIPILGILFRSTQIMYSLLKGYNII